MSSRTKFCGRFVLLSVGMVLAAGALTGLDLTSDGRDAHAAAAVKRGDEKSQQQQQKRSDAEQAPARVIEAFNAGGCGGCHSVPGVPGADGGVGPGLADIAAEADGRREGYSARDYIRESILKPDAFIAPECPGGTDCPSGVMLKSFAESLSDEQVNALVDYLATLGTDRSLQETESAKVALADTLPPESVLEPFRPLDEKPGPRAKIALGRYLFFDKRLSGNNSRSCASCHQPDKAFTDGRALSRGYPSTKLFRNTPSLYNVAFQTTVYRDGRLDADSLPTVARDHLTEAHFMAMDGRLMVERLRQISPYRTLFHNAFGGGPSFGNVLDAITAYVRSLNSPPTPYDRYRNGDEDALSQQAKAGLRLFRGKAGCVRCHQEPLLTDHGFHDLGVPARAAMLDDPERQLTFRRFFRVLGVPNFRNLREDAGRYVVTFDEADRGKFRTPGLREVARTAPYMHNGRFETLEEVVRFYNRGGGPEQTAGLKPLNLSDEEIAQLVAFLMSLSSEPVEIEPPELPDYEVRDLGTGEPSSAPIVSPQTGSETAVPSSPPPLAPLPAVPAPADNPMTQDKIELGKLLYFDPRMSADASISCNSCHSASTGWTIRTPVSMGGPGTSHWRNSQTILNAAFYGKLNWDGSKPSIEAQNAGAWGGAVAGNLDSALAEERLAQIPGYVRRFREVFGTDYPTWQNALRAVAAFQRTIVSRETPFDLYLRGDEDAISEAARRGHKLFKGQAGCITCHNGPTASDDSYHALGVPQNPAFRDSPLKQITFRFELASKGVPLPEYRTATEDQGLYYVTKRPKDKGKFRTPSLRGLRYTAPYMHNGVFRTLEDVVAFYNHGGGEHPNKSPLMQPLGLSEREQQDLVAFLRTLSRREPLTMEVPELPDYGVRPFKDAASE